MCEHRIFPPLRAGILTLIVSDGPFLGCRSLPTCTCVLPDLPVPALQLQPLPSFVAILFGSSLCIYTGKGLLGRGCRSREGEAVGEFSFPGIHAIMCAPPARFRNRVQEMDSYLMCWDRLDTGIWSL